MAPSHGRVCQRVSRGESGNAAEREDVVMMSGAVEFGGTERCCRRHLPEGRSRTMRRALSPGFPIMKVAEAPAATVCEVGEELSTDCPEENKVLHRIRVDSVSCRKRDRVTRGRSHRRRAAEHAGGGSKETPAGKITASEIAGAGVPVAVTRKDPESFKGKVALAALVMAGAHHKQGELLNGVRATPLCAVNVRWYAPPEPGGPAYHKDLAERIIGDAVRECPDIENGRRRKSLGVECKECRRADHEVPHSKDSRRTRPCSQSA